MHDLQTPGRPSAAALRELGLSWPCTEAELKTAWRRAAKTAHPDRGGTVEVFRRVSAAYGEIRKGLGIE